ncbi:glycoside hydrolase family 97 N-terminal domain-containing protein [Aquimarina sp. MAR_2010_214]|uniref:glycoside hydrolase family 97 N-terminal domain-containing protein n=1 Tax=Aquimarina sp. MAR_2010_214 TaxID=1250026 RepID=UPI000C70FF59|nr:glycoside hydrolase family 97 N-terminal domain-containing protein [Aquimarina sp. MAR_2010_214]
MILLLSSCDKRKESVIELKSPNAKISMHFSVNSNGEPWYMVHHKTETIIDTSFVGFQFKNKTIKVNHTTLLNMSLASGGGMAIHIKEVANY